MDLATISEIRKHRDNIREKIKNIEKTQLNSSTTYGKEGEYVFKGLIEGIECLLTDISTLTKAPEKFIDVSTYKERTQICHYLEEIGSVFENPTYYIPEFEALKVLLRNYNVRNSSDRQLEFESEISEVLKIKLNLQEELAEVKTLKSSIENNAEGIEEIYNSKKEKLKEIKESLRGIIEKKDNLIEQSETLARTNNLIEEIRGKADESLDEIQSSMNESKSNEKLITSFANRIQDREKKLIELEQSTEENKSKLSEYETERKDILKEATELIKSAKEALNYKTAEGISASFQEQYENSNNRWIFGSWIGGAVLCLAGAISLGIWVLNTVPDEIGLLIGRISLLPLPIVGAIFCANQYTKQKNIIEDYAYKMVLSKAIVGFSEQLKKHGSDENEEYIHYIKTSLEEIHKDPLRKRGNNKSEKKNEASGLKDMVEVAEKIIKMSKVE